MRKYCLFSCLCVLILAAASCNLESPIEFGMECDMKHIQFESGKCFQSDCPNYALYFEKHMCPKEAPYCVWDEKDGTGCSFLRKPCQASFVQLMDGEIYHKGDADSRFDIYLENWMCPAAAPYCYGSGSNQFCSASKEQCEAQYIQMSDGTRIKQDADAQYQFYFENQICPADAPYCRTSSGTQYCSQDNCTLGTRWIQDRCEPLSYDVRCKNVEYIYLASQNKTYSQGDNSLYDNYLYNHACPPEAVYCRTMYESTVGDEYYPEVHFCSDQSDICPQGSHLYNNGCERDSAVNCGEHDRSCIDIANGIQQARCIDDGETKKCEIVKCIEDMVISKGHCVPEEQCCGESCEDCSSKSGTPFCVNKECVGSCPAGKISCGGSCIDPQTHSVYCGADETCESHPCAMDKNESCVRGQCDCQSGYTRCADEICYATDSIKTCGGCDNDCTTLDGWKDGRCESGSCIPTQCQNGYHIAVDTNGNDFCELDDVDHCGANRLKCHDLDNVDDVSCTNGKCVVDSCLDGYHVFDDSCERDSTANCGLHSRSCNVPVNGEATCEHGECKISCTGDYVYNGSYCVPRSEYCSAGEHKCENSRYYGCLDSSWDEGIDCPDGCTASGCNAHVCSTGDHKCENNKYYTCSNNAWGSGVTCTAPTNGIATCDESTGCGKSCNNSSYSTLCGSACVNTNTNASHCGGCNLSCTTSNVSHSASVECSGGNCIAKTCKSGYHVYDNACEVNSPENCGSHGNACTAPTNGVASCSGGECLMICNNQSYPKLCGTTCVNLNNDVNNCGECYNECSTSFFPFSLDVECASGTCVATGCQNGSMLFDGKCYTKALQCGTQICIESAGCANSSGCFTVSEPPDCSSGTPCNCGNGIYCFGGYPSCTSSYSAYCFIAPCGDGIVHNGSVCCAPKNGATVDLDNSSVCHYTCMSGYTNNGTSTNPKCLRDTPIVDCSKCAMYCCTKTDGSNYCSNTTPGEDGLECLVNGPITHCPSGKIDCNGDGSKCCSNASDCNDTSGSAQCLMIVDDP